MDNSVPETISPTSVVRFGVFEADLRSGELHKSGAKIRIQELPFQALRMLVSHPNEVVSRDDLRKVLWPEDVHVEFDRGVISAINRLRDALGDSAENPIFIETVGRRGYRWIAPLHICESGHGTVVSAVDETGPAFRKNAPPRDGPALLRHPILLILAVLIAAGACAGLAFWVRRNLARHRTLMSSAAWQASRRAPASRDAERFYLEGRYYWEKRTPESLTKAVDAFTQAIVRDPTYAPAYVGLADSYNLLREYTVMPAYEAYPRALAAAKKAVELDPESSEAHASLAFASFFGSWDAASANREFQRAIELDPNNAVAHHWYATYLSCVRRDTEAIAEIERAQTLEPASKSVLADKGSILFNAGRRQDSIALLAQMEANEPDFISPHRYLKFIYLMTGDHSSYLVEARKEAALMHDNSALAMVEATERAFATGGGRGMLEVLAAEQKNLFDRGQFSPFLLATTYAIMGSREEALRYLKIAYDQRVDGVTQIACDHAFDSLHGDPAFQKLVTEVGLPPAS